MNIQTEHIENHSARLTVEVEVERLEAAKKKAARQLSKRYRIPGFRKGKAPYRIIANYIGEGAIIEEAIDSMTNDVYRAALEESGVEPYGPGNVEDVKLDPPTFVFTLPLAPTIDPGDYRSVRFDYTEPEVSDEDVDKAIKELQQEKALVEESTQPVAMGNRVTIDLHSEFVDGEENPVDLEEDSDDSEPEAEVAEDDAEAVEEVAETDSEAEVHRRSRN